MFILLPLGPNEIATVMQLVVTIFRVRSCEILFSGSSPPDPPLDYLSDEVVVIALSDKVVQVALSDDWLYISIL